MTFALTRMQLACQKVTVDARARGQLASDEFRSGRIMSQTTYGAELKNLGRTYEHALSADVNNLKWGIAGASDFSVIAVGSGGSFTVASLLANLHEACTGRVSRASTPLELICNPTLASTSPVFLISAEGKNPDIVEALRRVRMYSARPVHILCNRKHSPLVDHGDGLSNVSTHVFEITEKDGFLATNSLLFDATLIARVYGELGGAVRRLPGSVDELQLKGTSVSSWIERSRPFLDEAVKRGSLLVTFSPLLRPVAADLESKLAEAALLHCQLADLRSFAHGRHLWLAERPSDCAILALLEPSLEELWRRTAALLPPAVPMLAMPFDGAEPQDLTAGLVTGMTLVSEIADRLNRDPGRPHVPSFGREIHYLDISKLIPSPSGPTEKAAERSKLEVLGAKWPLGDRHRAVRRSLKNFVADLEARTFRGIVFDYDGTLCSSQQHDHPPSEEILHHIRRLADANIVVAIASGRGGSIQEQLQQALSQEYWSKVHVGLYNAGFIGTLDTHPQQSRQSSEFLNHVTRIVHHLKSLGAPIDTIRTTHPFQVSVRFRAGVQTDSNWFVIADAIRQAGLDTSRVVRSKHSVDVLGPNIDKSHLVAHVVQTLGVDPFDILTVGDQGAWPGNDSSLLDHRFSLSVDVPSRRLDRGWKLAPAHTRDVDATLWYLQRVQVYPDGGFAVRLSLENEAVEHS